MRFDFGNAGPAQSITDFESILPLKKIKRSCGKQLFPPILPGMQRPDPASLPLSPGVYLYKDAKGRIIYVGKARVLRRRILSYFRPEGLPAKTRAMLAHAASLDVLTTTTEKEALLLESSLIKKHRPHYNIVLRDDKQYVLFRFDLKHPFPRLEVVRKARRDGARYFGPFTSALATALFIADGETDKKVYCAASVKEQAGLVFQDAVYMTQQTGINPADLRGTGDLSRKKVYYMPTRSMLTAISRDARTNEGIEPSVAIIDELHVMPDGQLIDVLRKGMVTRRQPLLIYLTTAAHQGENICNDELDFARRVRDGQLDAPGYLPAIFEATESDDWRDEKTWFKANPGLGETIRLDRFRQEFQKAQESPALEREFKRLNLNMQGRSTDQWIDLEDWKLCPQDIDPSQLLGEKCTLGIDLSSTRDITALVLYFPKFNALLPYFFVPRQTMNERDDYRIWQRQGLLSEAGGAAIDENEVRRKIWELIGGYDEERRTRIKGLYRCRAIAYDPYRMSALSQKLREVDEHEVFPFRQGFLSMAEPTARMEADILEHRLRHFGNPVLTWMVSNAKTQTDPKGNTMLAKEHRDSKRKIDGIVAAIMAYGVYLRPEVQGLFNDDNYEVRVL